MTTPAPRPLRRVTPYLLPIALFAACSRERPTEKHRAKPPELRIDLSQLRADFSSLAGPPTAVRST